MNHRAFDKDSLQLENVKRSSKSAASGTGTLAQLGYFEWGEGSISDRPLYFIKWTRRDWRQSRENNANICYCIRDFTDIDTHFGLSYDNKRMFRALNSFRGEDAVRVYNWFWNEEMRKCGSWPLRASLAPKVNLNAVAALLSRFDIAPKVVQAGFLAMISGRCSVCAEMTAGAMPYNESMPFNIEMVGGIRFHVTKREKKGFGRDDSVPVVPYHILKTYWSTKHDLTKKALVKCANEVGGLVHNHTDCEHAHFNMIQTCQYTKMFIDGPYFEHPEDGFALSYYTAHVFVGVTSFQYNCEKCLATGDELVDSVPIKLVDKEVAKGRLDCPPDLLIFYDALVDIYRAHVAFSRIIRFSHDVPVRFGNVWRQLVSYHNEYFVLPETWLALLVERVLMPIEHDFSPQTLVRIVDAKDVDRVRVWLDNLRGDFLLSVPPPFHTKRDWKAVFRHFFVWDYGEQLYVLNG
jgi:hypothetical protein